MPEFKKSFEKLPWGAPVDEVIEIFHRDGGVILTDVFTKAELAQINADVDPFMDEMAKGSSMEDERSQQVHGSRTKRLTNVITHSPTYRETFLESPHMEAYLSKVFEGVCETWWLNTAQVIEIHPGETPQFLHRDAETYPIFNKYGKEAPEILCNMLIAMMDVTEEMGATRVIPGSHTWEYDKPASMTDVTQADTIPCELEAGSLLFLSGKVVHGGGANVTKDVRRRVISNAYNIGILTPEEAYPFAVPLDLVKKMSPRLQQMIGFRSFHQNNPIGGSLWQQNYVELADMLGL